MSGNDSDPSFATIAPDAVESSVRPSVYFEPVWRFGEVVTLKAKGKRNFFSFEQAEMIGSWFVGNDDDHRPFADLYYKHRQELATSVGEKEIGSLRFDFATALYEHLGKNADAYTKSYTKIRREKIVVRLDPAPILTFAPTVLTTPENDVLIVNEGITVCAGAALSKIWCYVQPVKLHGRCVRDLGLTREDLDNLRERIEPVRQFFFSQLRSFYKAILTTELPKEIRKFNDSNQEPEDLWKKVPVILDILTQNKVEIVGVTGTFQDKERKNGANKSPAKINPIKEIQALGMRKFLKKYAGQPNQDQNYVQLVVDFDQWADSCANYPESGANWVPGPPKLVELPVNRWGTRLSDGLVLTRILESDFDSDFCPSYWYGVLGDPQVVEYSSSDKKLEFPASRAFSAFLAREFGRSF